MYSLKEVLSPRLNLCCCLTKNLTTRGRYPPLISVKIAQKRFHRHFNLKILNNITIPTDINNCQRLILRTYESLKTSDSCRRVILSNSAVDSTSNMMEAPSGSFQVCMTTHSNFQQLSNDIQLSDNLSLSTNPRQVLNHFYQIVSYELQHSKESLQSTFIQDSRNMWFCTYNIAWPKNLIFIEQGCSKQEASSKAALLTVEWLQHNRYMDTLGRPLLRLKPPHQNITNIRTYSTSSNVDINSNKATTPCLNKTKKDDLFSTPKNVLHNLYDTISAELKKKDLRLTPQYKTVKEGKSSNWMCTYTIQWPEVVTFSEVSSTKKNASHKAASTALTWLMENKKIDSKGRPLINGKTEVAQTKKASYPSIKLDQVVQTRMQEMLQVYENDLKLLLATKSYENSPEDKEGELAEDIENLWPNKSVAQQRFLGLEHYLAHEPVDLPISQYKNTFIEMLNNNRILIIKGEPGCGKSTRVPQYVLEAWAREGNPQKTCRIVVTQPRRIAAVSLAERVAEERQESVGSTVGYHIRLKSNFNRNVGRIMYCTTGILLRRLQSDPRLSDCSHIILDEAHERDVNTDLLMNLLRSSLDLNPNLKLLVMSATLEAQTFQDYFNGAPILQIPGFTYPVERYFLKEHQNEFAKTRNMSAGRTPMVIAEDVKEAILMIHRSKPEGAILCFLPGWDEINQVRKLLPNTNDLFMLCLHSKLQIAEQRKVFSRPPPGIRKIILATNIAETSVTIDDVVYVIDTGIQKEERFDFERGVKCIDNSWISQSSATQRRGRAGRCRAGECFHLYPESKHDQLIEYSIPEILRTSLTKIILDCKVYSNNMNAMEFLQQLVCPPEPEAVKKAVEELKELELLDENENLTHLGRVVSDFQLPPKLSKAMVNSIIFKCVTPVVDIATLYAEETVLFANTLYSKDEVKKVKKTFSEDSDHLAMMGLLETWINYKENGDDSEAQHFSEQMGLVHAKLNTIQKVRDIHFDYLRKGLNDVLPLSDDFSDNDELVKAVLLSGVGTVLQHRNWDIVKGRMKKSNVFLTRHNQKATITSESVNFRRSNYPSDFLFYINETVSNLRHTTLVRETSFVSALAMLLFRRGELEITELSRENFSDKVPSSDQVVLTLSGTKLKFACDRRQAILIQHCKQALRSCVQYYIYELTKGANYDSDVNRVWKEMLSKLDKILVN